MGVDTPWYFSPIWIFVGILILLLVIFCICKRKIIANMRWKIMKRDMRLSLNFLKVLTTLWHARRTNLTIISFFEQNVEKHPHRQCLLYEDEQWSYKDMQEYSNQIGNYFFQQGFRKGDKIGLLMENRPEYVCIWLGLAKIGVVTAKLNHNLRLNSLQHCLKIGFCKAIIFSAEMKPAIVELKDYGLLDPSYKLYNFNQRSGDNTQDGELGSVNLAQDIKSCPSTLPIIPDPVDYHDELFYIYTSGTTGLPKAAIIKHSRYLYGSSAFQHCTGIKRGDIIYTALPLYHTSAAIFGIGQALQFGNAVAITKKFSASRFWIECIKHQATVFQYIGEICRYLLAQPRRPEERNHKIRLMYGNGLRSEIWTEFLSRFNVKNVSEFYGSTEGNCNLMCSDNTVGAVGFVPRYLSGFLKIYILRVTTDGEIERNPKTGLAIEAEPNEPGELIGIIKHKALVGEFKGYTDPEAQKKKIIFDVMSKGDSAFRSGDIVVRDRFGYFFFKDRQGDTFRWKGENVSTAEVENVVSKACDLRDTTVYGVTVPGTDGRAGMAAIVDPNNSLDFKSLAQKISLELPAYARPLFIRIPKKLDITGTFKFKKGDLQKEGFDVTQLSDPIYFFNTGTYQALDLETYKSIVNGSIRV